MNVVLAGDCYTCRVQDYCMRLNVLHCFDCSQAFTDDVGMSGSGNTEFLGAVSLAPLLYSSTKDIQIASC